MQKSSAKYLQTKSSNTLKGSYTLIKWDLPPRMQGFFSIHKSISVIHYINKLKKCKLSLFSGYMILFIENPILKEIEDDTSRCLWIGKVNIIKMTYYLRQSKGLMQSLSKYQWT